ncbi:hypothetical protein [Weissella paramesenteroides]|uniref:hypothetical protein n=1 Tax=Weissella paramesenteroides TaxID=1249 RepID=UPI00103C23DA|nr:hypothetical protein [Weissella paramesenteroides]RZQ58155.1 hypothetical protein EWR19_03425 [Weissella paramesenteroides]
MIKTTVTTPANTYQLCVQQHYNQVSVAIDANTPNLATATFRLTVSDTTIAHYFVNYLGGILSMTFQATMSDAHFLSNLQQIINQELPNWQRSY